MSVATRTNVLSLASGGGGLDLGVRLAVPDARAVCYVENEVTAAAILVARIQDMGLDDAPVWSNLRTFDSAAWRGSVDLIIGGYPCQPFSVAGRNRGHDDPRNLWPAVRDTVEHVRPRRVFFENVSAHLRRGFYEVARDLRGLGYEVAATLVTASEVGAPHKRERLFIMADATQQPEREPHHEERPQSRDNTREDTGGGSGQLVNPAGDGRREQDDADRRPTGADWGRPAVGNADLAGPQGRREPIRERPHELPAWPPGPEGDWGAVPERFWPATPQSEVRGVADGVAGRMDLARADRLRTLGNGVVPAQAAYAYHKLEEALSD